MIYAGLDIATRTGCAIFDGDALLHAEAFRPKGAGDAEIFHGFRTWLRPLIISFGVQYVAIEEPLRSDLQRTNKDGSREPASNMSTYLRLYGLRAHCIEICHALNVPCEHVHQSTWRKAFLGNGRGDKDASLRQCKLLGFDISSKDAGEAVGVAWWLAGHLRVTKRMRPGEFQFSQGGEAA